MKQFTLILISTLTIAASVLAIGPSVPLRVLTWTPSPTEGVTGHWLYYRTPGTAFDNSRRVAISTNSTSFDLMLLGFSPGVWDITLTATNALGAESAPSNIVQWNNMIPARPTITAVTQ